MVDEFSAVYRDDDSNQGWGKISLIAPSSDCSDYLPVHNS